MKIVIIDPVEAAVIAYTVFGVLLIGYKLLMSYVEVKTKNKKSWKH